MENPCSGQETISGVQELKEIRKKFQQVLESSPTKVAIRIGETAYNFQDIWEETLKLEKSFSALKFKRVGIYMDADSNFIVCCLQIIFGQDGITYNVFPRSYTVREVLFMLKQQKIGILISDNDEMNTMGNAHEHQVLKVGLLQRHIAGIKFNDKVKPGSSHHVSHNFVTLTQESLVAETQHYRHGCCLRNENVLVGLVAMNLSALGHVLNCLISGGTLLFLEEMNNYPVSPSVALALIDSTIFSQLVKQNSFSTDTSTTFFVYGELDTNILNLFKNNVKHGTIVCDNCTMDLHHQPSEQRSKFDDSKDLLESSKDEKNQLIGLLHFFKDDSMLSAQQVEHVVLDIGPDLCIFITKICEIEEINLSLVFQFVWHVVLKVYGTTSRTTVGTMVVGSDSDQQNPVYNPVVFVHNWQDGSCLIDKIKEIKNIYHGSKAISTNVENYDATFLWTQQYMNGSEFQLLPNFPLSLVVSSSINGIKCTVMYNSRIFQKEKLYRALKTMRVVLEQVVSTPRRLMSDLQLISTNEYNKIVVGWNDNFVETDIAALLHNSFAQTSKQFGSKSSIVCEGITITFKELDTTSSRLCSRILESIYIVPDDLVCLYVDRSVEFVVGILGILKAGGAYLPMEPLGSPDRESFILTDSRTKLVISQTKYKDILGQLFRSTGRYDIAILFIDDTTSLSTNETALADNVTSNVVEPSNLAYCIYTSGTTGKPKGVLIEHQNVMDTLQTFPLPYNPLNPNARSAVAASFSFDSSIIELFVPLLRGVTVHILSNDVRGNPELLSKYLLANRILYVDLGPAMLSALPKVEYPNLVGITYGGETLSPMVANYWSSKVCLINCYGPTEAGICATWKRITGNETHLIGKPYSNAKVYVVNECGNAVPIFAPGELSIGGRRVGRGYLNLPVLTDKVFLPNKFEGSGRIYKTGDMVRWTETGDLEFLGRVDHQVKLRGFRIELKEIESVVGEFVGITDCVVDIKLRESSDGQQYKVLVAYYVSDSDIDSHALESACKLRLPEYMVPGAFVRLKSLPVAVTGKINRKALPNPVLLTSQLDPITNLQKELRQIWSNILGLPEHSFGMSDSFLQLGGDSILSIQVVSRVRAAFAVEITVKDIMVYKTIEGISKHITHLKERGGLNETIPTEQGVLTKRVPLLPIQQWFFDTKFAAPDHWNQSFICQVPSNITIEFLKNVVISLQQAHDLLKATYKIDSCGEIIQSYNEKSYEVVVHNLDVRSIDEPEGSPEYHRCLSKLLTSWQSGFDIENGPLWSIGLLTGFCNGKIKLWFAFHHLIIDRVSWNILVQDIRDLYHKRELPPKGTSFRQWVGLLKNFGQVVLKEQEEYWQNAIYPSPVVTGMHVYPEASRMQVNLNEESTKLILRGVHDILTTNVIDILLSAYASTLGALFKNSANTILLEGHGREDVVGRADISRTTGWFTSIYPLRLKVKSSVIDTIKFTKDELRRVPDHGIGFGAVKGYDLKVLPQFVFNYLGVVNSAQDGAVKDWDITSDYPGERFHSSNIGRDLLGINAYVVDGTFRFAVETRFGSDICQYAGTLFKSALENILTTLNNVTRTYLTTSDIEFIIIQNALDKLQADSELESVVEANSLQECFVFHHLGVGGREADAYFRQFLREYNHSLDLEVYEKCWRLVMEKFPSLRFRFEWENGKILQIIHKTGVLNFKITDVSHLSETKAREEIDKCINQERLNQFKLNQLPLFRVQVFRVSPIINVCLLTNHHAVLDGWSLPILNTTLSTLYNQMVNNVSISVTSDESYFSSQRYLQNHKGDHTVYWKNELDKIEERNVLIGFTFETKNLTSLYDYKEMLCAEKYTFTLKKEQYRVLKSLLKTEELTWSAILQFAWHTVLHVFGKSATTVVGTVVSGRTIPVSGVENSVGLYANTLPIIVNHGSLCSGESILDKVREIHNTILEVSSKSTTHLSQLQKDGQKIFDSLFAIDNYPDANSRGFFDTGLNSQRIEYPLILTGIDEGNETMRITLYYATDLFPRERIHCVCNTFEQILSQLAACPNKPFTQLQLLTTTEHNHIVVDLNRTEVSTDRSAMIHSSFTKFARAHPDKVAVVHENVHYTFNEVNVLSDKIAARIQAVHVSLDELVVLYLDRGADLIISVLGVLKCGCGYLPMEPLGSSDRELYILKDSNTKLVICNDRYSKLLFDTILVNNMDISLLIYETTGGAGNANDGVEFISPKVLPSNLACCLYTSGTTGKPKGVLLEHRNIMDTLQTLTFPYDIANPDFKALHISSVNFDWSVLQIFAPLIRGYTLHVLSDSDRKDPREISKYVLKHSISHVELTPVIFANLPRIPYPSLLGVTFGGEQTLPHVAEYWSSRIHLNQIYGPTECSIYSTFKHVVDNETNLIGSPYGNVKCYVLNKFGNPLPVLAAGELAISGIRVGRGYLNLPDLTAQRFIKNPFADNGEKMYMTGDMVRWTADGYLEFLGRFDTQVKIRGNRIELKEIEAVILDIDEVSDIVVDVRFRKGDGGSEFKVIVAYYVSASGQDICTSKLESVCSAKLPEYMLPALFIRISRVPMTINGKVDKQALPEPTSLDISGIERANTATELQLLNVFSKVLDTPPDSIGVNDTFFQLGGDSLLSIQLAGIVRRDLGLNLTVKDIFKLRTIRNISAALVATRGGASDTSKQERACLDLSTISKLEVNNYQRVFMPLSHSATVEDYCIVQASWKYECNINVTIFNECWNNAVKKYPALRTTFIFEGRSIFQIIVPAKKFNLSFIDLCTNRTEEQKCIIADTLKKDRKQSFWVSEYPLLRVHLFALSLTLYKCVLTFHHAILDKWSLQVLLNQIMGNYSVVMNNGLNEVSSDKAYWQAQIYLKTHKNDANEFWEQTYSNSCIKTIPANVLDLVGNFEESIVLEPTILSIRFKIVKKQYTNLKELTKIHGVTYNSVLQFAWHCTLSKFTHHNTTIVSTVMSGRAMPIDEIEKSVGLYINTLPVVINDVEYANLNVCDKILKFQSALADIRCNANIDVKTLKTKLDFSLFIYENTSPVGNGNENSLVPKNFKTVVHEEYPITVNATEFMDCIRVNITGNKRFKISEHVSDLLDIYKDTLAHLINTSV